MEARLRVEEAGSRLGALRKAYGSSAADILAAEMDLAEARFEWAVEKALVKHKPSLELADRLCKRLQSVAA